MNCLFLYGLDRCDLIGLVIYHYQISVVTAYTAKAFYHKQVVLFQIIGIFIIESQCEQLFNAGKRRYHIQTQPCGRGLGLKMSVQPQKPVSGYIFPYLPGYGKAKLFLGFLKINFSVLQYWSPLRIAFGVQSIGQKQSRKTELLGVRSLPEKIGAVFQLRKIYIECFFH